MTHGAGRADPTSANAGCSDEAQRYAARTLWMKPAMARDKSSFHAAGRELRGQQLVQRQVSLPH
jgi:hypothetical protein